MVKDPTINLSGEHFFLVWDIRDMKVALITDSSHDKNMFSFQAPGRSYNLLRFQDYSIKSVGAIANFSTRFKLNVFSLFLCEHRVQRGTLQKHKI